MTQAQTRPLVRVQAPASKSASHRAVICAALARGGSLLSRVLDSDDLGRTMACLGVLGARFERQGETLAVTGLAGRPRGGPAAAPADLDVHESGTTARLMTAVAAAGQGSFRVFGAPRMHQRPMAALCQALAGQGAAFRFQGLPGHMPFVMDAFGLAGGLARVDAGRSSQYLSGLLLAAPMARAPLAVEPAGDKVVSWPYVALTLAAMEDFGIVFEVLTLEHGRWVRADWRGGPNAVPGRTRLAVTPGPYRAGSHVVEGDWSNASYFLAAGAVGPVAVTVTGLRPDSLQGDRAILDILRRMGAGVEVQASAVTVSPPPGGRLTGLSVDMGACPDIVPTVAVLAAMAQGETHIFGAAHLRLKECDRIAAPAAELARVGCGVEVLADGLRIRPGSLGPCAIPRGTDVEFSVHNDHRMAMSLSLLELAGVGVRLDEPGCVAKSFPDFFGRWDAVRRAAGQAREAREVRP